MGLLRFIRRCLSFKEAGLTTTGPVDLEKPLKVTIEENKLLFNQGYQIEIIGDADIETSGGKNF